MELQQILMYMYAFVTILMDTIWRWRIYSFISHYNLHKSQETHTLCVFDRLPVVSWRPSSEI